MDENYTPFQIDRLFEEFFEQGLKYFFPFAIFKPIGFGPEPRRRPPWRPPRCAR